MNKYIVYQQSSINNLINDGVAEILDIKLSAEFDEYVSSNFAWLPTRIDWDDSNVNFKSFEVTGKTMENIRQYVENSPVCKFSEVGLIYSANQPGIILKSNDAVKYLHDLLPEIGFKLGAHFMVGIKRDKFGLPILEKTHFIEIDNKYLTSAA